MRVKKNRIIPYVTNSAKNVTSKNVDKVNMELLLTLNETTELIQKEKCKDVVPYILWNDFINQYGTLAPKVSGHYNRYTWGTKVFVDFGMTNVQTELSYPHPAIILYNFNNTVIVVPTTTDDKATSFTDDIEKSIIKVKSDGSIFLNDSIINIHQICAVHKQRIISDLHCNVKNYIMDSTEIDRLNSLSDYRLYQYNNNLLDCIRIKLTMLLNDQFVINLFVNEAYNINTIYDLKKEIEKLKDENNKLKESIDKDEIS